MAEQETSRASYANFTAESQEKLTNIYLAAVRGMHEGPSWVAARNLASSLANHISGLEEALTLRFVKTAIHPSPAISLSTKEVFDLANIRGVTPGMARLLVNAYAETGELPIDIFVATELREQATSRRRFAE